MGYLFLPSRCMLVGSVALWATCCTAFMPKLQYMNAFKCMCRMCCEAPALTQDAGSKFVMGRQLLRSTFKCLKEG